MKRCNRLFSARPVVNNPKSNSNMRDLVDSTAVPFLDKALEEYRLAKKFYNEMQLDAASEHIRVAIQESSKLTGVTPAISSFKYGLFELEEAIKSSKNVPNHD